MALSVPLLFHTVLSLLTFLHQPTFSFASPYKPKSLLRSVLIPEDAAIFDESNWNKTFHPTTFFEVREPIQTPKTRPISFLILQHDFGFTHGKPPVLANFTPPSDFESMKFEKIVFQWKATSRGRQFDRILGVWISGVEIFRSCTAEPKATGIVWTVQKDITRYSSLLKKNQSVAVYLENLVDSTHTGVYHVNISMHFYPAKEKSDLDEINVFKFRDPADLILPISRTLPLNSGLWFEIQNSSDVQSKRFKIPQNVYRAVLEVYVSFHDDDESWYTNFYDDYIAATDLTSAPGNGPFREVVVNLDGNVVGSVWPFTVVYTGGINPLLWRPISSIGSFDLPSYDIELTPFLGEMLDSKTHSFEFSVTNGLNVWLVDANLHLWLDRKSEKTEGRLISYGIKPVTSSYATSWIGFDGAFSTNASKTMTSSGWVKSSSYGTLITTTTQECNYTNSMVVGNEANRQIVNQTIDCTDEVLVSTPSYYVSLMKSRKSFPLYLSSDIVDHTNGSYTSVSNVSLGLIEEERVEFDLGVSIKSVENLQKGEGSMAVRGNLVVRGMGSTEQTHSYKDDEFCYFRNVSSSNYSIAYDEVSMNCSRLQEPLHLSYDLRV